jgi:ABC-type cobalamin/Fe3+-siderophores transport system ATPase subunit
MGIARISVSLFATIAVIAAILAGATIWLLLTDPITVADAVNQGNVSPLISELADALLAAFRGLLRYL